MKVTIFSLAIPGTICLLSCFNSTNSVAIPESPIAHYELDGTAIDASQAYSGSLQGSPKEVADRRGKPNGALYFGKGNYVSLPNLGLTGNVSVSGWIKID